MGLCPSCQEEGETVTFIGGSEDETTGTVNDKSKETDETATAVCDLCSSEYQIQTHE